MRKALIAWTFASLACSSHAQARLERAAAELAAVSQASPDHAFAFGVVGREGEPIIRTAGRLDAQQPFESWARIPLGNVTLLMLDYALDAAVQAESFGWNDPIGKYISALPQSLRERSVLVFYEGRDINLPYYYRFLGAMRDARALDAIVTEHTFELLRYERAVDQEMLRAAIAQLVLERATEKRWDDHVDTVAKLLELRSVENIDEATDAQRLVRGRRADGTPLPVQFAEVPAFGNATASLSDAVKLARSCLLGAFPDPAVTAVQPSALTRRFSHSTDDVYGIDTHSYRSDMCGVVLHIEIVPEANRAFLVFGNQPNGEWVTRLRDALMRDIYGRDAEPEPDNLWALGGGPGGAKRHPWPRGIVRANVPVGEHIAVVDVRVVGRKSVNVSIDGVVVGEIDARIRWKAIEIHAPLPALSAAGEVLALDFTVAYVPGDNALSGVAALQRATLDGIAIERLPRPVQFDSIGK